MPTQKTSIAHSWHNVSTNPTRIYLDRVTTDDVSSILQNLETRFQVSTWEEAVASLYQHLINYNNPHRLTKEQLDKTVFDKIYEAWIERGYHGSKQELMDIIFRYIPVVTGKADETVDTVLPVPEPLVFRTTMAQVDPAFPLGTAPAIIVAIPNRKVSNLNVMVITLDPRDNPSDPAPQSLPPLWTFGGIDGAVIAPWNDDEHDWMFFAATETDSTNTVPPMQGILMGLPPSQKGRPQALLLGEAHPGDLTQGFGMPLLICPHPVPKFLAKEIPLDSVGESVSEEQVPSVLVYANYVRAHNATTEKAHVDQLNYMCPDPVRRPPALSLHRELGLTRELAACYDDVTNYFNLAQLGDLWNATEGTFVFDVQPAYLGELEMLLSIEAKQACYQVYIPPHIRYLMADVPTTHGVEVHTVKAARDQYLSYVFSYRRNHQTPTQSTVICGHGQMLRVFKDALSFITAPKMYVCNLFKPNSPVRALSYYPYGYNLEQCRFLTSLFA